MGSVCLSTPRFQKCNSMLGKVKALGDNLGYVVSLHKLVLFELLEFDLGVAVLVLSHNFPSPCTP